MYCTVLYCIVLYISFVCLWVFPQGLFFSQRVHFLKFKSFVCLWVFPQGLFSPRKSTFWIWVYCYVREMSILVPNGPRHREGEWSRHECSGLRNMVIYIYIYIYMNIYIYIERERERLHFNSFNRLYNNSPDGRDCSWSA